MYVTLDVTIATQVLIELLGVKQCNA